MSKWSDMLILIAVTAPAEETDEQGFYLPPIETRREVFANKKSVGYNEFYKSAQAGMTAEAKFIVRTDEYRDEGIAEHEGKRYRILRTYETTSIGGARGTRAGTTGEFTELTLTDLREREAIEGGGADGKV